MTEDGVERPVDCIILGTGFIVDPRIYMQNFPVTGLPGHTLGQDWKAGAEAYYGITVTGYPNLFQLVGPNTALGHNSIIFMIECQVHYVLECIRELRERKARYLDVSSAAQAAFNRARAEGARGHGLEFGLRELVPAVGREELHHLAVVDVALLAADKAREDGALSVRDQLTQGAGPCRLPTTT